MNEEFIPFKPENYIFAHDQGLEYYPAIEKLRSVNESGYQLSDRVIPSHTQVLQVYWSKQYKFISLIGIVSSGVLFMVLFQNTGIGVLVFQTISDTLGYLGSLILNPVMELMPHF